MPGFTKTMLMVMGLAMITTVAACQSSEERAEEHFQNAISLMEEGDTARATVEFRNVFQNNGQHREARQMFASMLRDLGDTQQSYSQYLRLIEQFPDDVQGRIALAEMAIEFQNWDEVLRHGGRAIELAPDDPAIEVIETNIDYFNSFEPDDPVARRDVAERATALLQNDPDNILLQRLIIDSLISDGELEAALARLEELSVSRPENRTLYNARLGLLVELEREDAVEVLLRDMIARFPDDAELPGTFLRFLMARGETEQAEAFLRELAESAGDDAEQRLEPLVALVRLRLELDGPEAAIEELDQIIASDPGNSVLFRSLRASLQFEAGDTDTAIAELEAILEQDDIAVVEAGQIRVTLAQMLLSEGNIVGARRLVEQVLEEDPGQADALQMLSAWLIEEDEADRAISQLRIALDSRPDNPAALTLMAQAHARNGNRDLSNEFLALAVEASGAAPEESLRYAQVLVSDERYRPAEEILIDALRLVPGHVDLLNALGDIYVLTEDWPRADQVERTLRDQEQPVPVAAANSLRTRILEAQGRRDEALAFLENLVGEGEDTDLRSQLVLIGARLSNDDFEGALAQINTLLEDNPDSVGLRLALAAVQVSSNELPEAEASFRIIVESNPELQQAWIGLLRVLSVQGKDDEATAVLEQALEALPEAPDLLWAQASYLERIGDFEGAIALYERLYEMAPNAAVVANNLASLITTYRDDEESLDRAYTIARRLRGSDVAPFQDTYGWIAYRRGELNEALSHLEPAADALNDDPIVQYHLGMTYRALGRNADALVQLTRAVELAGPDDTRTQFESARTEIAAIEADIAESEEVDEAAEEE